MDKSPGEPNHHYRTWLKRHKTCQLAASHPSLVYSGLQESQSKTLSQKIKQKTGVTMIMTTSVGGVKHTFYQPIGSKTSGSLISRPVLSIQPELHRETLHWKTKEEKGGGDDRLKKPKARDKTPDIRKVTKTLQIIFTGEFANRGKTGITQNTCISLIQMYNSTKSSQNESYHDQQRQKVLDNYQNPSQKKKKNTNLW